MKLDAEEEATAPPPPVPADDDPSTSGGSTRPQENRQEDSEPELIDIAVNLGDEAFARKDDFEDILGRALQLANVRRIVACTGSVEDAEKTFALAERLDPKCERIFATVGVHPTRAGEFETTSLATSAAAGGVLPPVEVDEDPTSSGATVQQQRPASGEDDDVGAAYFSRLKSLIEQHRKRVIAYGEFGLVAFARRHFPDLPFFLHCRGEGCLRALLDDLALAELSSCDIRLDRAASKGEAGGAQEEEKEKNTSSVEIVNEAAGACSPPFSGVIHSFTGTLDELQVILQETEFHVGLNGCSLRTEENCAVAAAVPLERLMLETDCPYCDLRPSAHGFPHVQTKFEMTKKFQAGKMYKSRNEPARVKEVAEVIAGLKGCSFAEVATAATRNTLRIFGPRMMLALH